MVIQKKYRAIISSDWNQCLAPCGPFDPIIYHYPKLAPQLDTVFKAYTANQISLEKANHALQSLLPNPLSPAQMDAYLEAAFMTYKGVADLIQWSQDQDILFMINTTGLTGYFQRIFAKGLLPPVPVLSSNSMLRYSPGPTDPDIMLELADIQDKGKNTEFIVQSLKTPWPPCILMGDSGGDGPHFEWGAQHGAFLIGSMPKSSLHHYCREKGIKIDLHFGFEPTHWEPNAPQNSPDVDFMALTTAIKKVLDQQ